MVIPDHGQLQMQKKRVEEMQRKLDMPIQDQNTYFHQQYFYQQDNRSKFSLDHKLGNIRQIVKEEMPAAYTRVDEIRTSANIDMRAVRFHHSRGATLAEGGVPVLEFNMAGSGYSQFRKEHKGFIGKKYIQLDDGTIVKTRGELKVSKVRWYNKYLSWLRGIRSVKQKLSDNANASAVNKKIREEYGESTIVGMEMLTNEKKQANVPYRAKYLENVRTKVTGNRTKISMAGPLAKRGSSNSGDYSIENLRVYMLQLGSRYLKNIFDKWIDNGAAPHEVRILIQGHSRGGVASVEGAMMIKHWISRYYPQYEDFVKFDLIQYDPVPGTGSRTKTHVKADHRSPTETDDGEVQMKALGESANTTVVYSLHSNHPLFFVPQQVEGASRIILAPFEHSVGLHMSQETMNLQGNIEKHRAAYTAQSGEVYRGSGINDLGEGVYIVDEYNTLVRFNTFEEAQRVLDRVQPTTITQRERHKILLEVTQHWFDIRKKRAQNK